MKTLIWPGLLLLLAVANGLFLRTVPMGAIPSMLYYGAFFGAAYAISWKWDKRKRPDKEADRQA